MTETGEASYVCRNPYCDHTGCIWDVDSVECDLPEAFHCPHCGWRGHLMSDAERSTR